MARPPIGGTPARAFRCSEETWKAAQAQAVENDETVSEVIVKFLRRYGRKHLPGVIDADAPPNATTRGV